MLTMKQNGMGFNPETIGIKFNTAAIGPKAWQRLAGWVKQHPESYDLEKCKRWGLITEHPDGRRTVNIPVASCCWRSTFKSFEWVYKNQTERSGEGTASVERFGGRDLYDKMVEITSIDEHNRPFITNAGSTFVLGESRRDSSLNPTPTKRLSQGGGSTGVRGSTTNTVAPFICYVKDRKNDIIDSSLFVPGDGSSIACRAWTVSKIGSGKAPPGTVPTIIDLVTQVEPFYVFASATMVDAPGKGQYHNDPIEFNEVLVMINTVLDPSVPLLKPDKHNRQFTTVGECQPGSIIVWPANRIANMGKFSSKGKTVMVFVVF